MFHRKAKKQLRELCRKMRMAEIEEADDMKCYELLREFKETLNNYLPTPKNHSEK